MKEFTSDPLLEQLRTKLAAADLDLQKYTNQVLKSSDQVSSLIERYSAAGLGDRAALLEQAAAALELGKQNHAIYLAYFDAWLELSKKCDERERSIRHTTTNKEITTP